MKYNRPGFAVLPHDVIWYYITQVNELDNSYIRAYFPSNGGSESWFNLDTGERVNIDTKLVNGVFAKFFAKEAGIDWYT